MEGTVAQPPNPATQRHTVGVGYSPYRKFTARPGDYVMVIAAALLGASLVVWAFVA